MAKTKSGRTGPASAARSRSAKSNRNAKTSRSGAKRSAAGKTTTDHDKIRRWAEERGGTPATVRSTARGEPAGILRIDFPDYRGEATLKKISWDAFFRKFDQENLAFLYQDKTASGRRSRFGKFVDRPGSRG